MAKMFANVGAAGGIATFGGDPNNLTVNHESAGTYRVTWNELSVIPAAVASPHNGVGPAFSATPAYVTKSSMYIHTRDDSGAMVNQDFSFIMFF